MPPFWQVRSETNLHPGLDWLHRAQGVNIRTTVAENINSTMSVEYSPIRPCFQAILLPGRQRMFENISAERFHLGKLGWAERDVWVKRFKRRMRVRPRHVRLISLTWLCVPSCPLCLKPLLHDAPSRIVPQHWSGKEQSIDAVQHAPVARQNCS